MTPKQILDSFSETLMQDERILSAQERTLLMNLIHHAQTNSSDNPEVSQAVNTTMAAAVGETVAQRAFTVLGANIVERIVGRSAAVHSTDGKSTIQAGTPAPTGPSSGQPGPRRAPSPPHTPVPEPKKPEPHDLPQPGPRGSIAQNRLSSTAALATMQESSERATPILTYPEVVQPRLVVLDEFLAPDELHALTHFALDRESDFGLSEVVLHSGEGIVDNGHRRSRALMDLSEHRHVITQRIKSVLPVVLNQLGIEEFQAAEIEAQITASNNEDFFGVHNDNGSPPTATRQVTFVYFFHREPRQFRGGDLRIYDSRWEGNQQIRTGSFQAVAPQQNQIVFFRCGELHEITPVGCSSGLFADSRFTVNGWIHR